MQKIDTARGVNSHNVVTASFSCQRTSILSTTSDWIVSPPGGALQRFGAAAAKTVFCNKKPGVERRADPPILRAMLLALGRTCSMLDFFLPGVCIQTHLWIRRRKPVRLRSAHLCRRVFASGKYSKFRNFVKYL